MLAPRPDLLDPWLRAELLESSRDVLDDPQLRSEITLRFDADASLDVETGLYTNTDTVSVNALRREVSASEVAGSGGNLQMRDRVYLVDRADLTSALTLDSYALANGTAGFVLHDGNAIERGQTFQVDRALRATSLTVRLRKAGAPSGDLSASIYATTGTHGVDAEPTGSALAEATALEASDLTTSFADTTFTFADPTILAIDTTYAWTVGFSAGDTSNRVEIGGDNSSPTHDGNRVSYTGSTWTSTAVSHVAFLLKHSLPLSTADSIVDEGDVLQVVQYHGDPLDTLYQIVARRR